MKGEGVRGGESRGQRGEVKMESKGDTRQMVGNVFIYLFFVIRF